MKTKDRFGFLGAGVLALTMLVPAARVTVAADPTDLASSGGDVSIPHFVDETRRSGIEHVYDGGFKYFTGGGVAVFDCDADGLDELYIAGGDNPAELYHNDSAVGGPLRFSPIADAATGLAQVTGAYPLDIDGDGVADLAVLRSGENVLLRGLGDCRFERANEIWGFDGGDEWTNAFSAKWEGEAQLPTLAFGDYIDDSSDATGWACSDSDLLRPAPSGTGYAPPIALTPGYCTLSMLFSDWDRSGRVDLRVSNDRQYYPTDEGGEQLWRVAPGEAPSLYTTEDGWQYLGIFGMGIASYDVTGDGYPDVFLSSMGPNRLQTLADGPGQPTFTDISRERGVTATNPLNDISLPSTAWHDEFEDVNNDGLIDLFISKGNVNEMPDHAAVDPSVLFLGRPDGTFTDQAARAGIDSPERGRGAAVVDLNLDGLLDVFQVNRRAEARVWRNLGSEEAGEPLGDWLAVDLEQSPPNRDAIGAWIEVKAGDRVLTREVTVGGGHAGGQLGPVHFGLGADSGETAVEVRVQWPDREWSPWRPVERNRFVTIRREDERVVPWQAPALVARADAAPGTATCVPYADPDKSVARLWDEALLDAIRRDFPAPTVHARNLYHLSAAMWDAWAAYDPEADGIFVTEKLTADDRDAARQRAISYAAYRLLGHRYKDSNGGARSLADFDDVMASLCLPTDRTSTVGTSAAALGNRIAERIISVGLHDGSHEDQGYASGDYKPVNEPLRVADPGTVMADPNRWQPLDLEIAITQNGQLLPSGPQRFVGPYWGHVTSFALPADVNGQGLPIDPGPPPLLGDADTEQAFKDNAVGIIRFSSMLDPRDGVTIDISPGAMGANTLGTNDGTGLDENPVTGRPYDPDIVLRADFARALAEFWADGPASETPPGHWNTLANAVTDTPGFQRRIAGEGRELGPLEWDVKMYLALNGAVHDAAIAAWGAKGYYDYSRPISMIRYMGGLGQSSLADGPSFHPDGLPLEPGLVEVITEASSAPGERHEHLADHVGEIAIRAWTGGPEDTATELGGVGWIRAVEWVPYQKPSFVTPAFAGYVSGHSTFSRAAAEVLALMTGSPYFPGGLGTWTIPAGSLEFEAGPAEDIELQWASYYDAADQAGISRLYGGIHVEADDLRGRVMGAQCGKDAWATAIRYWEGSART